MDIPLAPDAKISVTRYPKSVVGVEPDAWVGTAFQALAGKRLANPGNRLDVVASVVAGRLAGSLVFEDGGNIYARA